MKVFIKTQHETDVPQVNMLHTNTQAIMSQEDNHVVIADLTEEAIAGLREQPQFEVYEDIQFSPAIALNIGGGWWSRQFNPQPALAPVWAGKTQADVMQHNKADQAWNVARGQGVTIAVVDTGTDGAMKEFLSPQRSLDSYAPSFSTPWADTVGHGTMCAALACGSKANGGRYNGVAPDATLLTARTTLLASDLYLIYQDLLIKRKAGKFAGGLVVSNSYGLYTCAAPNYPQGHPYVDLVKLCIAEGIVFVFAAGNNHAFGLCQHPATDDQPNTIWAVNSIDEVITVGTVDWHESNQVVGGEHGNSSRGPGQWSVRQDKPDVVAPTYGEVVWGAGYQKMEWWGTSGACPQVAGLAALLLSRQPTLTPDEIRAAIRNTARPLAAPPNCVGAGIIDCAAAVNSVP